MQRRPLLLALALASAGAVAQDGFPSRKAGLWHMTMQGAGMPAGTVMQQCVDARTDQAMQRRAMSAEPGAECRQTGISRAGGVTEVRGECTDAAGRSTLVSRVSGDMSLHYKVENRVSFDPPRRGQREMTMTIEARHRGACPADLAPGSMRLPGGMTMHLADAPASAPHGPQGRMTPEQLQQMLEQMQRAQGGAKP